MRALPDPHRDDFFAGKPVCVTGGTGFLGYHVVQALLQRGARVRVLSLHPGKGHPVCEHPRVDCRFGDVRDPEVVRTALAGCEVVFHTAATVEMWRPGARQMQSIHCEGTRNVLRWAPVHARIVHTSSLVTLGPAETGEIRTEDCRPSGVGVRLDYLRSKLAAEELALEAASAGRDVVVANPAFLVGPQDFGPSVMGRLCLRFWKGRVPLAPPGGLNVVDVRDAAAGHLLVAERGAPGRRYVLGGENRTFADFFVAMARTAGWHPRAMLRCPAWLLQTLAGIAEARSRWANKEPYPSFEHAALNRRFWYGTSERAIRELGYQARSLVDCLSDTYAWHHRGQPFRLHPLNRWWLRAGVAAMGAA